jgi:hypothetical protein
MTNHRYLLLLVIAGCQAVHDAEPPDSAGPTPPQLPDAAQPPMHPDAPTRVDAPPMPDAPPDAPPVPPTGTVTITSPAKPTGLRAAGQDSLDPTYINNATPTRTAFAISGTCSGSNAEGSKVVIELDASVIATTPATVLCTSGAWSATTDATAWADGSHVLAAGIIDPGGIAANPSTNQVAMYSWKATPTISWANDIKPMFANPLSYGTGDMKTCIDCHVRGYNADPTVWKDGSAVQSFGYWAACSTNGGTPLADGDCTGPAITGQVTSGSVVVSNLSVSATTKLEPGMLVKGNWVPGPTQATGATTSGSAAVTLSAASKTIVVGMAVTGAGIPAGTTVSAFTPNTTAVTLSASATATTAATTLAFTAPPTTIVSVDSATQITLSNAALGSASGNTLSFTPKTSLAAGSPRGTFAFQFGYIDNVCTPAVASQAGTTTTGSADVPVASVAGITVGMNVYGAGVPFTGVTSSATSAPQTYTTVAAVDATTNTVTLSAMATASGSTTLSFLPSTVAVNCDNGSVASSFVQVSANADNYRRGLAVVNDEFAVTHVHSRSKIVRGQPTQSMIYEKTSPSDPLTTLGAPTADGYLAKTGMLLAAGSSRMPAGGPIYFSVDPTLTDMTKQNVKLAQWIVEGARTDN